MEIMNRSRYSETNSHKNIKKRRTTKTIQTNSELATKKSTRKEVTSVDTGSVFTDFLMINASLSNDESQKPRSHANARERDRTHRCVILLNTSFLT